MPQVRRRSSALLTRRALAARWCISPWTVARMVADGLPVAVKGGGGRAARFDPEVADRWREARDAARRNVGAVSLEQARTRKELAIAIKTELDIARRQGELVEMAEVARTWAADSVAIRARLRALPRALAPQLVVAAGRGVPAVRAVLADAIDAALRRLADGGLRS